MKLRRLRPRGRRGAMAMQFSKYAVVIGLFSVPFWVLSCSPGAGGGNGDDARSDDGANGGRIGVGGSGASANGGTGAIITQGGSSGSSGSAGTGECVTCTPPGGTYCGQIGDNCGGSIDCGICMGDWTCEEHVCVGGESCDPLTCDYANGRYCGTVGNGCGRALDCGACTDGR